MIQRFTNIQQFLSLFQDAKQVKPDQWKVQCPCHDDKQQSLYITGDDHQIGVYCFAGCQTPDIMKAKGLTMAHLFFAKPKAPTQPRQEVGSYDYTDANGKLLYQVVRFKPKTFRQRRLDRSTGDWVYNLDGITPVLYRLPELAPAIEQGKLIVIPEGEKDSNNVTKHLGFMATTSPMGAGKWRDKYADTLVGGDLILIPDADTPGHKHIEQIAKSCYGKAKRIRILELPSGFSDISDWIEVGYNTADFESLIEQAKDYTPPEPEPVTESTYRDTATDTGNAERLVKMHGDNLRYCYETKKWLAWTGKLWEWDLGARINKLAKLAVLSIYREAADEPSDGKRKVLVTHARQSESDTRMTAMINRAKSELGIPVGVNELDTDDWLLNCPNGTIDLRTGKLLPHSKEHLITMMVHTEYHPNAECPLWLKFLERVCRGDGDLIAYLQRCVGYSLTGDTRTEAVFFMHGRGQNGKSTFIGAIRTLMGDYGHRVNPDIFMVKDKNLAGPKEGLANLRGKRCVIGSEIEEGRRLAMAIIKATTGAETITADRKYEHEIEYQPKHKLWLSGNYKPEVKDTTVAAWRRLKLIPFSVHITDDEKNESLKEELKKELEGILAWAVRGCLDWQQQGLAEPNIVKTATAEYRSEQDTLGNFIAEKCVIKIGTSITKGEFKGMLKTWCIENNLDQISQKELKSLMLERGGITEGVSSDGKHRLWKGIRALTPDDIIITEAQDKPITDKIDNSDKTDKTRPNPSINSLNEDNKQKFLGKQSDSVCLVRNKLPEGYPPYPTMPCRCGSDEFWPGPTDWLCCRCHPRPEDK